MERFGKAHPRPHLDVSIIIRPNVTMMNAIAHTRLTMTIRLAGRVAGLAR
jgi:hypothetical protein